MTISTGMLSYVPGVGDALQRIVRGGAEIGSETLLAFYTYHTTVLPVLLIAGMAFHFWRVRRAGGSRRATADGDDKKERPERILFFPDLLVREIAQALVVLAVVVLLGAFVGASIGERANPGMSPNPAKAPWYFMGFQELLDPSASDIRSAAAARPQLSSASLPYRCWAGTTGPRVAGS